MPEQVVTPGEELWVKIIDIDLQRRRISLSIKQAAEGGEVAAEYREVFGEHTYDDQGNYVGPSFADFEPESEAQAAWAEYLEETATAADSGETTTPGRASQSSGPVWTSEAPADEPQTAAEED
jgi:small subunit ribosomal protein S1